MSKSYAKDIERAHEMLKEDGYTMSNQDEKNAPFIKLIVDPFSSRRFGRRRRQNTLLPYVKTFVFSTGDSLDLHSIASEPLEDYLFVENSWRAHKSKSIPKSIATMNLFCGSCDAESTPSFPPTTTEPIRGIAKGHNCIDMTIIVDASLKYDHLYDANFVVHDFNTRFLETLEYYRKYSQILKKHSQS